MPNDAILLSTQDAWNRIIGESSLDWPDEDVVRCVSREFAHIARPERSHLKVLDIGFGTGRHIIYLLVEGFSVCGLDYAQNAVTATSQRLAEMGLSAELRAEELSTTSFETESFDLILLWGVMFLKPTKEIQADLAQVITLLKPGGLLCLNFRTLNNWFFGLGQSLEPHGFLLDDRAGPYRGSYYRFCSKEEVEALLQEAGLEIVNLEYKEWHKFGREVHSWWIAWARKPAH
jgi:SAM-dependent methyltransferase